MQDDIHGGYSQIQVTEGIEYWKQSISQSINGLFYREIGTVSHHWVFRKKVKGKCRNCSKSVQSHGGNTVQCTLHCTLYSVHYTKHTI